MSSDSSRSEQVVAGFKRHKIAVSALRRIHELIQSFEQERAADVRLARIGITLALVLLGLLAFVFFNTESITLS